MVLIVGRKLNSGVKSHDPQRENKLSNEQDIFHSHIPLNFMVKLTTLLI